MVGDPSGRTDMRQMMTREMIDHNVECFKNPPFASLSMDFVRVHMISSWEENKKALLQMISHL